jgi:hypothetical protein
MLIWCNFRSPNIGSINDRILSLKINNFMKQKFFVTQYYAILEET